MFFEDSLRFFCILLLFAAGVWTQETPTVNILFVYQEEDTAKLFEASLTHINMNPSLNVKIGKVHRYRSNATEAVKLIKEFCDFVDKAMEDPEAKPDIAIDFTRIGVPSEGVKAVLKSMQMPVIAATFGQEGDVREWRTLDENQKKYMIQVSPPADILVQSVRSIVDIQNMTSAVLLFDDQYEMYHKYKSLLQNMPTRHLLTKTKTTNSELKEQIVKLVHVDIVNFFIAGNPNEITEVLTQASDPQAKDGPYFSDEFAWYSMSMVPGAPQCSACQMDTSVVHLSPMEFQQTGNRRNSLLQLLSLGEKDISLTHMFYFDLSLDAILAVADMKIQGKWTHDISNNSCTNYNEKAPYPSINLDLFDAFKKAGSDNIMGEFTLKGNGMNFPNFKMELTRHKFQTAKTEAISRERIGVWTAGFGEAGLLEYDAGKDLVQHMAVTVFRIVTVIQPPFVYYKEDCTETGKYANCFYGYCIDLLNEIKKDLKFNFTIRNVTEYGYMDDVDHKWSGMVKELQERRADIALGAMSVMAERESVVDFTVPYYDLVGISILMKKPKTVTSLFKFLTVLENDVWLCILGAYFFTSFLMWIFDRWSPYSYQNNREKYEDDEEKREFNLKECLWFCMTSLTPQGGGEAPKNLSGRLVAATWWLFGFIIIASYTANLAAFLTVSRLDAPIESLEDLSKQYKIQYAPMNGSSAYIYFNRMAHIEHRFYEIWKDMSLNDSMDDYERSQLAVWDYPVSDKYTKMWQAMQENKPPQDFQTAIDRVRQVPTPERKATDQFAFLDEATNIKYQTTIGCEFDQKGEEFSRKPYAIAVQKGSPLKESMSHMILKLLNMRYLEQLKEKWWNDNELTVQCPKDDSQSDGISIHNIGGVFIVIFVGIIMACFTLIFEYWWYRKRNVAEEIAEMALPPPKEFGANFNTVDKTNFNTQFKNPANQGITSIENSW